MKVDAGLIFELRKEKSWFQEELSIASSLNLKTIQRIEEELHVMKKYEYKSVVIKFDHGWFKKGTSNVDDALNEEAADGWKLSQMIMPTDSTGGTEQMIAILEREIAR